MSDQSAHAANLRADGFKPRLYLSDLSGSVLATCEVDTTPTDGAIALAVTVLTGSLDNAIGGMRIVVTSAGGAYKGTISISYRPAVSPTSIPIRELSPGEVPVEAGDILTVYDDVPPVDMLPAKDKTFAPDSEGYTDQNDEYDPLIASGGSWAGWVEDASVPFKGSDSILVDPDSATAIAHTWSGTGSPSFAVGNANSADPTLQWSAAGNYRVTHLIEDPDNEQTAIQFPRVRVHDANDPPYEIVLSAPPTNAPETGFTFSFTLFDNPSVADLRDGAHVILWSDDTNDNGAFALTPKVPGRAHIVAEGYLRRDEGALGDGVNGVTFEVVSPLARLAELPGFSKVFIRDQTPAAWNEYKSLTVKRAIIALLRVYTNIAQIHDLIFDGFDDADYPLLYIQKQNPYEQVQQECKGRLARLTCDRAGRLEVQGELWAVDLDDRAAVTTTYTFTDDDCIAPTILKRDHVRPLETFKLRGFVAGTAATTEEGTTAPVFARYPATPARGGQVRIEERAIVDTPTDVFRRCSLWAAWANADYYDADDRSAAWQHAPELTRTFPLQYARMFQNYREYVAHDGTALDEAGRQVDLSDFDWIPGQVSEDYASQTCQVTFRAATYAPALMSVDDTPPAEEIVNPIVILPPTTPPTAPDPNAPYGLGAGVYDLGFVGSDGYVYLADTRPTEPNWSRYDLSPSGTTLMFIENAFNGTNGVLITTTTKYRALDLSSSSRTLDDASAFAYTSALRSLQSERGVNGLFAVCSHDDDGRVDVDYTGDAGVGWTNVPDIGGIWVGGSGDGAAPGCHVFPDGRVMIGAFTGSGSTTLGRLKIAAAGALGTFSDYDSETTYLFAKEIHVPFQDSSIVYYGGAVTSVNQLLRLYKKVGGAARVDVSPYDGSEYYGPAFAAQFGIKTCDVDKRVVVLCGQNRDVGGTVKRGVWLAKDGAVGAASWIELFAPGASVIPRRVWIAGDSPNVAWLGGAATLLQSKNLLGATPTWRDLSGNLATLNPTVQPLNLFGV